MPHPVSFLIALFFPLAVCAAEMPPLFPFPVNSEIKLEDCIPGAVQIMEDLSVQPGERILLVSDRTVDPMANDAFYAAAWRMGAKSVDLINLQGRPDVSDPVDVILEQFEQDWWPKWVWDAAAQADRVFALSFMDANFIGMDRHYVPGRGLVIGWEETTRTHFYMVRYASNRERLATSARFPSEVLKALEQKQWQTLLSTREYHLTDPNGTNLRWYVDDRTWARYFAILPGKKPTNHAPWLNLANPPTMEGKLVTTKLHSGPIPKLELTIEKGEVVAVEGGGKMGEHLRQVFEEYQDVHFPFMPGPGVNWVEYAVWGVNPSIAPVSNADELAWTGKFWGEEVDRRSGVAHVAIGTAVAGLTYNFALAEGLERPVHHKDFELLRPTLTGDGHVIIDRGHLTDLEDPKIRKIASKYGDPDQILKVRWKPDDDPRYNNQ